MTATRRLRAVLAAAGVFLAAVSGASAHRMPEVYVTIGTSELEGQEVAAFTFRFHAEDALRMLGLERDLGTDLSDPALLHRLGVKALKKVQAEGGTLSYFGGETDGDAVFLYFTAAPGTAITEASVLSSVYERWSNRINDERHGEAESRVFTQGGELHEH